MGSSSPVSSSGSVSYELRDTTVKRRQDSTYSSPKRRKVLTPSKTASYVKTPSSDTHSFDPDKTRLKLDQRIYFTYERFSLAFSLQCETSRGKTHFNGSHAKVEDWEAAHASFAPTMYDNYHKKVKDAVAKSGFSELSPPKKQYMRTRFNVDTPYRKMKQGRRTDEEFFDVLTGRLSKRQKQGSYVNTETEWMRNSTVEQPRGANRFDCHLENVLRDYEDTLAEECSNQSITPQQATELFIERYLELVKTFVDHLKTRQKQFARFIFLHNELKGLIATLSAQTSATTSSDDYKKFMIVLKEYLGLRSKLKKRMPGAPSYSDFISYSQERPISSLLKQLDKNNDFSKESDAIEFFHQIKDQLVLNPFSERHTQYHLNDLANRLKEGEAQLAKLKAVQEEPVSFDTLYQGIYDSGARRSPTDEEIQQQFISKMQPVKSLSF